MRGGRSPCQFFFTIFENSIFTFEFELDAADLFAMHCSAGVSPAFLRCVVIVKMAGETPALRKPSHFADAMDCNSTAGNVVRNIGYVSARNETTPPQVEAWGTGMLFSEL